MFKSKKIAIILPDTLQSVGLRSMLIDYFSPVEISLFTSFEIFFSFEKDIYDFYFTLPDIFVSHLDFFLSKRNKTICIVNGKNEIKPLTNILTINISQEEIIKQLRSIFHEKSQLYSSAESNRELSIREIDVLQLIVKGFTNKEIADKLYISLNTVLTHRKNITSKLGIKTIPGLTFYAITHGLISGSEIKM